MTDTELIKELQQDADTARLTIWVAENKVKVANAHYNRLLKLYQKQLVKCKEYQDYIDSKEISPTLRVGTRWVQNGVYVV